MPAENLIRYRRGREGGWNLRYFLTDDSAAAEQKGFREAFDDMDLLV